MTDSKGKTVRKVNAPHTPSGPFAVYSDGDGHYSVIREDGQIAIENEIAWDYCMMKAIQLNRGQ